MTSGGSGSRGHDFLRTIAKFTESNAKPSSANKPVKLGRVDYAYNPADFLGGVNPRILFDGENTVSQKRYQVLSGYYPLPGARVALIPVGTTYLIIGSVENIPQDPKVEIFTSSDTWEKSPGARMIRVQVQAGGGGGGGCPNSAAGPPIEAAVAGGGGGGGYAESWITANAVGSSETVTVGTGGAGGAAGANAGSTGGSSSFGSLVSANGGEGGTEGTASSTRFARAGGTGGTATGDLAVQGGDGFNGYTHEGEINYSAGGGDSQLSQNRRGTAVSASSSNGTSGYLYGGGGGGGVSRNNTGTSSGGDGAAGIVIVTTYF